MRSVLIRENSTGWHYKYQETGHGSSMAIITITAAIISVLRSDAFFYMNPPLFAYILSRFLPNQVRHRHFCTICPRPLLVHLLQELKSISLVQRSGNW